MTILQFLDPPKSPAQQLREAQREANPGQEPLRTQLSSVLWFMSGVIVGVTVPVVVFAHWMVASGLHR